MNFSISNVGQESKGMMYLFSNVLLAGIFPVVVSISLKNTSPIEVLLVSTVFATAYFAFILTIKKKWQEIINADILWDIFWTVMIIGVAYQLLFFFGLSKTTPGNASIISLAEIFFSFLFFHVWKKENIRPSQIFGAVLIIMGVSVALSPRFSGFHVGDMLIVLAASIAPFGNFFQRRAREKISGNAVMFLRSFFSVTVLFIISLFFQNKSSWSNITNILPLLILNGILMLGIMKSFWLEAIHRVSVVKANAVGSLAPIITLLVVWLFMQIAPTNGQLFSLVPIIIGFLLLNHKEAQKYKTILASKVAC